MEVDLLDFTSDSYVDRVSLPKSIFSAPFRPDIISFVINWQLAKRRKGTHSCKGVSDVSGTTRKPYRQKGTGRARQGSLRSTQFRGGGVTFGPVVRSHAFSVNKKVRNLALSSALSLKVSEKEFFLLQEPELSYSKTSKFVSWIKSCKELDEKKKLLIVTDKKNENLLAATSNLHKVKVIYNSAFNVYDIINHDAVLACKNSLKNLESRFSNE